MPVIISHNNNNEVYNNLTCRLVLRLLAMKCTSTMQNTSTRVYIAAVRRAEETRRKQHCAKENRLH